MLSSKNKAGEFSEAIGLNSEENSAKTGLDDLNRKNTDFKTNEESRNKKETFLTSENKKSAKGGIKSESGDLVSEPVTSENIEAGKTVAASSVSSSEKVFPFHRSY